VAVLRSFLATASCSWLVNNRCCSCSMVLLSAVQHQTAQFDGLTDWECMLFDDSQQWLFLLLVDAQQASKPACLLASCLSSTTGWSDPRCAAVRAVQLGLVLEILDCAHQLRPECDGDSRLSSCNQSNGGALINEKRPCIIRPCSYSSIPAQLDCLRRQRQAHYRYSSRHVEHSILYIPSHTEQILLLI
jgi:hypothetical protein